MIAVTRKKKMLGLIGIFLLFLACYLLLTTVNKEKEDKDTSVVAFLTDADQITAVSFAAGGENFSFSDNSGTWAYDDDDTFPLNTSTLQSTLKSLSEISATRELTGVTDFDQYGLGTPAYEIYMTSSKDGEITLDIGDANNLTDSYYFRVNGGDSVYLVDSGIFDLFDCTLFDFITTDAIPSLTDVSSLTFDNGKETTFVQYPDGYDGWYSPLYTWFMKNGDDLTAADSDDVQSLITTISGLSWTSCVAYNVSEDDLADYGLDDPTGTVSVDYKEADSGKTDDKNFTLLIGDSIEKASADDSEEATTYYYAKTADSDLVYLISGDTAKPLLTADDTTCPVWDLCQFDRTILTNVDIADGDDTHELAITSDTGKDDDGKETTTYTYTLDGDSAKGDDFFDELDGIEGMKFTSTPEKADGDVVLTLTFHQGRKGFETMKMTFTQYDDDYYLVSFNGYDNLLISTDDFGYISDAVDGLVSSTDE